MRMKYYSRHVPLALSHSIPLRTSGGKNRLVGGNSSLMAFKAWKSKDTWQLVKAEMVFCAFTYLRLHLSKGHMTSLDLLNTWFHFHFGLARTFLLIVFKDDLWKWQKNSSLRPCGQQRLFSCKATNRSTISERPVNSHSVLTHTIIVINLEQH